MISTNAARNPGIPVFKSTRLLDQCREQLRYLHYSLRTEEAYLGWVKKFIRFHGLRHPHDMARAEVEQFLMHLAAERRVCVSTHQQALSALLFLYQRVLGLELPWMDGLARPVSKKRIPVVLSPDEVQRVLSHLKGEHLLLASLLYGGGLRLMEGLRLRVKDVDFEHRTLIVRDAKGGKDRVVMLPERVVPALKMHLSRGHDMWTKDRGAGLPGVEMPHALMPNTLGRGKAGPGIGCFHRRRRRPIRAVGSCGGIMPTIRPFRAHSSWPCGRR
jgi:integrase